MATDAGATLVLGAAVQSVSDVGTKRKIVTYTECESGEQVRLCASAVLFALGPWTPLVADWLENQVSGF